MSLLAATALRVELGHRSVLDGVNFSINSGELVGLLGPNGAGKTTLLRVLAGLQQKQTGSVRLLDRDLGSYTASGRARRLAYLPQGGQCHWPMSVTQVVALGRLPHRAPWARIPPTDEAAVQRALRDADVAHLAERITTELSGGERARVLLARALAVEAQVLLADEPTAGLDPAHQLSVMSVLRARAQSGTGVVVVLHDLTLAARFCDRLVLLGEGRVVAVGVPSQVLTPEHLGSTYRIEAHYLQTEEGLLVVPLRARVIPDDT
ncbi:MAG: ABC transporter ATP-binding protein [Nevskiales bacterium]